MNFSDITAIRLDQYRLENSLSLISHQDSANPIVCLQLYIKTGSVRESPQRYGYAHFLEHLVFKSTPKYPLNMVSTVATAMGMVLNAYTDFDATCYYIMLPKERLTEAMDILAEMAMYADFSDTDVNTEKDIIIEEIHQYESDPEMSFIEYIQTSYFPKSPLSHPVLGSEHTVRQATRQSLHQFYRKHYRPSNAVLVASGDFDPFYLQSVFATAFSGWQDKALNLTSQTSRYPVAYSYRKRKRPGPELLAIALPELNEQHPESEAMHIAIRHLAIGKSSLLHKELVEERKLCSFVRVSSISGLISGISVILMAPTQARHKHRIIDTFFKHWSQIMNHGVPDEAIKLVKKDIIHSWLYSFDGVEHKANLIAAEIFNQDLGRIQSYGSLVESITNPRIIQAVRDFWPVSSLALYHQGLLDYKPDHLDLLAMRAINSLAPIQLSAELPSDTQLGIAQKLILHGSDQPDYYRYTLSSGMQLVYNYLPKRPICGFALSTPLSQLNEQLPGQNYFSSALMLYGTQQHSHAQLMQISRQKGFNIRVQHHLDSTIFRGKCHFQDLPEVLGLVQEILTQPIFAKSYLQMLKSAALDGIRREQDYPASYAYNRWFAQLFGKQNRLLHATGNKAEIKALTLEDCQTWHQGWHLGRDFSLCIVGSFDPEWVHELSEQLFGGSTTNAAALPHQPIYSRSEASQVRQYRHKEQSIIHIGGYACPASRRSDNSAFHILAQALGGDLSSRMYAILREKYGFAYQTGFDFSSIEHLGFWYAYAFCDPEDYRDCLRVSKEIINDVALQGISPEELESAKNYLISINRFDAESVGFRATVIANLISLGYDLDFYLNRESRIAATSLEQIRDLAQEWLSPPNQFIHVIV